MCIWYGMGVLDILFMTDITSKALQWYSAEEMQSNNVFDVTFA